MTDEQWHLDKRVTVTVLTILLGQTGALLAWGLSVERSLATMQVRIEQADRDNARQDVIASDALRELRTDMRDLKTEIRGLREQLSGGNGRTAR